MTSIKEMQIEKDKNYVSCFIVKFMSVIIYLYEIDDSNILILCFEASTSVKYNRALLGFANSSNQLAKES